MQYAYGLSREEAIDANSCDGSKDQGLDAYYVDDDYLYLFQFKHHDNPFGQSIPAGASGPVNQLANCWKFVSNLDVASEALGAGRIRRQLYDAAVTYKSEVLDSDKEVKIYVVVWGDGSSDNARAAAQTWLSSLGGGVPIASVDVENFHDVRRRSEELKAPSRRYAGSKDIGFIAAEGMTTVDSPHKAITVHILGSALASLFRDIKEDLFDTECALWSW